MARTNSRSPEERVRILRRVFFAGAAFEIAACIALLFLLRWPTNLVVVLIATVMLTAYNIVYWRAINKQARDQSQSNPYDVL